MDVWSREELERLVEKLAERGVITDDTAERVRETLYSDGFRTAVEQLQAEGVFAPPRHDD